jgi:hypothetical protein
LIHADGGIGKTVFLQSISKVLGERHETVLFDCCGDPGKNGNRAKLPGDPSVDLAYGPNERNTVSGPFIAYRVTKSAADIANNHDQVITFYFDAGDHLEKITSSVHGIASRP